MKKICLFFILFLIPFGVFAEGEEETAAAENKEVLSGVVTEVVKGGVIVTTKGVRVFVPASQATASRNDSLEDLLKQEVNLRIIEINRQRRQVGRLHLAGNKALPDKLIKSVLLA